MAGMPCLMMVAGAAEGINRAGSAESLAEQQFLDAKWLMLTSRVQAGSLQHNTGSHR